MSSIVRLWIYCLRIGNFWCTGCRASDTTLTSVNSAPRWLSTFPHTRQSTSNAPAYRRVFTVCPQLCAQHDWTTAGIRENNLTGCQDRAASQ